MRLTDKNYKNTTLALDSCKPYLKLGQLEDIEEEINVGLLTLFKQPYCTIFIKKDYGENYKNVIEEHTLYSIIPQEKCITVTFETIKFYWKDYGKTWSLDKNDLTKEELEK